ncbi:DUF6776 family protein [Chitinimonas koreensis]|uniref:DUF6776 family protein n=1 Tax=Chitinimonas koreensis TaxID=356302 RepID=UPI00040CACE3|nr:DUF6776 family protein [Chitinimonas koreensis]QNM95837.1 hypothetical protein H9L41_18690 [Chitinimonas koreensis]
MIGRWKRRGNHLATARLAVKRHLPWYARIGLAFLLALVLAALGFGIYRYGEHEGRRDPNALLAVQGASVEASRLAADLAEARQRAAGMEQQIRLETATRETLARQIQQLQGDNGSLREQIAFYESLLTKTDRAPALAVEMFRVEPVGPGRYRLRAILVQGQSSQEAFKGEIDFRLVTERGGHRETLNWPQPRLPLTVSRFTRIERETELPADAKLRQVELRVYGSGEARARLSRIYDVKG